MGAFGLQNLNTMLLRTLKHCVKIAIGRPDPSWPLFVFEKKVNPRTWKNRVSVLAQAEECLKKKDVHEDPLLYTKSKDPLVKQGYKLKQKTERGFKDLLVGMYDARILIHVPDPMRSPAGYSLFTNFAEAFEFVGVPTKILGWNDEIKQALNEFKPTILLSSDHITYLERIDWVEIEKYRQHHKLQVGLTASLEEYGNTPLLERLDWAQKHHIDFYYSFRDSDYVHTRKEYQPFFEKGFDILFLPFGVNIEHYYPVPNIVSNMKYAFLASVNGSKAVRYIEYMLPLVSKYHGIIDGPGWQKVKNFNFNRDRDRYVYARSKIGLNIHLQEQIDWACEVNERTFMLAACGVPQVIDDAKLLPKLFSKNALFVAKTPEEYQEYFEMILKDPKIGIERALIAQYEVFERHTTFHRAQSFIKQLEEHKLV